MRQLICCAVTGTAFALAAGPQASAQYIQMDFVVTFDEAEKNNDFFNLVPANLVVTGSICWTFDQSAFSNNGLNLHSWEYISYEATAVGTVDGFDGGFTVSGGPTNGSSLNSLRTIHVPTQSASNLSWETRQINAAVAQSSASFNVHLLGVGAMPLFTSPLPQEASDYVGSAGGSRYSFTLASNGDNYIMLAATTTFTFSNVSLGPKLFGDANGDGVVNFSDITAVLGAWLDELP